MSTWEFILVWLISIAIYLICSFLGPVKGILVSLLIALAIGFTFDKIL